MTRLPAQGKVQLAWLLDKARRLCRKCTGSYAVSCSSAISLLLMSLETPLQHAGPAGASDQGSHEAVAAASSMQPEPQAQQDRGLPSSDLALPFELRVVEALLAVRSSHQPWHVQQA